MSGELIADLQATRAALTRQLDTIDAQAQSLRIPREELRAPNGTYVAAPVLVALAQVQVALLGVTPPAPIAPTLCGDLSTPEPGIPSRPCALVVDHDGDHHDGVRVSWGRRA